MPTDEDADGIQIKSIIVYLKKQAWLVKKKFNLTVMQAIHHCCYWCLMKCCAMVEIYSYQLRVIKGV